MRLVAARSRRLLKRVHEAAAAGGACNDGAERARALGFPVGTEVMGDDTIVIRPLVAPSGGGATGREVDELVERISDGGCGAAEVLEAAARAADAEREKLEAAPTPHVERLAATVTAGGVVLMRVLTARLVEAPRTAAAAVQWAAVALDPLLGAVEPRIQFACGWRPHPALVRAAGLRRVASAARVTASLMRARGSDATAEEAAAWVAAVRAREEVGEQESVGGEMSVREAELLSARGFAFTVFEDCMASVAARLTAIRGVQVAALQAAVSQRRVEEVKQRLRGVAELGRMIAAIGGSKRNHP